MQYGVAGHDTGMVPRSACDLAKSSGDIMCRGVPTASVLMAVPFSGTTRGLEVLVLIYLTFRRWIGTCDHSRRHTGF
jgi:hypothetical protein